MKAATAMGEKTKIAWCGPNGKTFSPWLGCAKVASGCVNCYAEAQRGRFGVKWGPNGTRRRTAESTWKQVEKWNRRAGIDREKYERETPKLAAQYQWQPPRVFPSLCDIFESWGGPILGANGRPIYVQLCDNPHPNDPADHRQLTMADLRRDFFALIDRCPNLDFLLLTKRPESIRRMWEPIVFESEPRKETTRLFRPNCWLLFSASDQQSLDAGLPHLLACRDLVPVLGLSLEPLLGPVDVSAPLGLLTYSKTAVIRCMPQGEECPDPRAGQTVKTYRSKLDGIIVGGESGPRARPCDVDWIRSIVQQCKDSGVPCFVKQLGAYPAVDVASQQAEGHVWRLKSIKDPKGGDWNEWPEDLRVRRLPKVKA